MAGISKRNVNCWTCRLRKKGCDGAQPVCESCALLKIICHRGPQRPEWMDGGPRQHSMVQQIKAQIRDGIGARREQRSRVVPGSSYSFVVMAPNDFAQEMSEPRREICPDQCPDQAEGQPEYPARLKTLLELATDPLPNSGSPALSLMYPGRAWELDFSMIYLDYVFPFLFPFYRPPLIGTSRAWLLSFLRLNEAVFHSVLSLSAFFFTVGLRDILGDGESCKRAVWALIVQQADLSFASIQGDISANGGLAAAQAQPAGDRADHGADHDAGDDGNGDPLSRPHIMETIAQMLVFERFVSRSAADWNPHLTAALALLGQLLDEASTTNDTNGNAPSASVLLPILQSMVWSRPAIWGLERPVWNPDQAAFRFFAAFLVFTDVVASTALSRAPQLRHHYDTLLGYVAPESIDSRLDLTAFVGVPNWVVTSIGHTSALAAWKREQMEASGGEVGSFQPELNQRAISIMQTLNSGLDMLASSGLNKQDSWQTVLSRRLRKTYYQGSGDSGLKDGSGDIQIVSARIWALAARLYLRVLCHGWDLHDLPIRADVAEILPLLQSVDSMAHLHTFAWPLCIAGSLAWNEAEKQAFAAFFDDSNETQLLRAVREAGSIVRALWEKTSDRGGNEGHAWDISTCLQILGTPALLI